MKQKTIPTILISLLVLLALACSASAPSEDPIATPDAQATVNFAIAATSTAQAGVQATIDGAMAATTTAMPPTATPGPTVEVVTLTEEELEALIDQAVEEAIASTNQASAATTQVVEDDTITQEEIEYIEAYVYGAEEAIAYAEELISMYYGIYGELAYETVELLLAIEDDLETMANSMVYLTEILVDVEQALVDGVELAAETIMQLEDAAQVVVSNLAETQSQLQDWVGKAQVERENRVNALSNLQPNQVPSSLPDTLREAFSFVDQVRGALSDDKFTLDELSSIAQLGANLSAGFSLHGGDKFQGFSGKVDGITLQLAQGQLPQARDGIGSFEASLGKRPEGLLQPGGGLPKPSGNLPQPGGGNLPQPGGGLRPGK